MPTAPTPQTSALAGLARAVDSDKMPVGRL